MTRIFEEDDFLVLNEWRQERGIIILSKDFYPERGRIVDGIAAGFLTETDTNTAIMENFVSNPQSEPQERGRAIIEIIEHLTQDAIDLGYKYLLAVTSQPKVEEYIEIVGGKRLDVRVFGRELNGDR